MESVTESTVRAVARRLKHYIDVERREEGFDCSGPRNPSGEFTSSRGGTRYYNSFQDKHLKHYFSQPLVQKQLESVGVILPEEFNNGHPTKGKKGRQRSRSAAGSSKSETSRLVDTTARLLLASAHSASSRSSHSTSPGSPVATTHVTATPSEQHTDAVGTIQDKPFDQTDFHSATDSDPARMNIHVPTASSSSPYPPTTQCFSHSYPYLPQGGPHLPLPHPYSTYTTPQQPCHLSLGYPPPVINPPFLAHPPIPPNPSTTPTAAFPPAPVPQRVMVESVGVSTLSYRDASTQTLRDAETQTIKSTLAKRHSSGKLKTSREQSSSVRKTEASSKPASISASTDEIAVEGRSEHQEQNLEGDESSKTVHQETIVHTFIHEVARSGSVERLKELISDNPSSVKFKDDQGSTPLHVACAAGRNEIVQVLCSSGADMLAETPTGYTAMHFAAMHGHVHSMKMLSAMNCSINCKTVDDQTPLHLAAMSGHAECCKWLVANRASLDAEDKAGRTPIDLAKEYNHEDIGHFLVACAEEVKQSDSAIALITTPTRKRKTHSQTTTVEDIDVTQNLSVPEEGTLQAIATEDEWTSDVEQEGSDQSAEKKKQQRAQEQRESQQQMYREIQAELKKGSSSFLDLAREEVEAESPPQGDKNAIDSDH